MMMVLHRVGHMLKAPTGCWDIFIHQNVSVDIRTEVQISTLTSYFVMSKRGLTDLMFLFRLRMQSTNIA